jgi:membrane associated rhomboid family serine protease
MLGILIFSVALERKIGTKEYILYYFLCGILAGVASYFSYLYTGTNAILLGASGALYSIMLLFAVFFPTAVILIFGILPVRAPILVLFYFIIEFFSQASPDGVAHATHWYGLIFGWLYLRIRMRIKPMKVWGIL